MLIKKERGFTLIEVLVALAILGVISAAFLSALGTASRGVSITDERETAKNLAESQMEYVKSQFYADSYAPAPIPSQYTDYSAEISVRSDISSRDSNIQNISVIVKHHDKQLFRLEGYRVN